MYTFRLKSKNYFSILGAFHILMALILLFDSLQAQHYTLKDFISTLVFLISSLALLAIGIFRKKIKLSITHHLEILKAESVLLALGAIYFWSKGHNLVASSHALISAVIILFRFYIKKRKDGEFIIVSRAHILIPSMLNDKIIQWSELNNLVKNADLLTIDFRNNKVLQAEITNENEINEIEFNRFCSEHLIKPSK